MLEMANFANFSLKNLLLANANLCITILSNFANRQPAQTNHITSLAKIEIL